MRQIIILSSYLQRKGFRRGVHGLRVLVTNMEDNTAEDEIWVLVGLDRLARERAERDQDNVLEAWPEDGLPGTQLGPNKHRRT